jgi:hypothetical protein
MMHILQHTGKKKANRRFMLYFLQDTGKKNSMRFEKERRPERRLGLLGRLLP